MKVKVKKEEKKEGYIIVSKLESPPQNIEAIKEILKTVNNTFSELLLYEFLAENTSNFWGILKDIKDSFEVILYLQEELFLYQPVFCVTEGEFYFTENPLREELSKEAFNKAKEGIKKAKINVYPVVYRTEDERLNIMLEVIFSLFRIIKKNWSIKKYEKIKLYKRLRNMARVAEKLGVTYPIVSRVLKQTDFFTIDRIEKDIKSLLHQWAT